METTEMATPPADLFREGVRDGIPIALGYFAVSFTLGIAARNAGLTAFQGFLASLLNNASAGEYAGFVLIAAGAAVLVVGAVLAYRGAGLFPVSTASCAVVFLLEFIFV